MAQFDLDKYLPVQERVCQFYQDFPNGSIRTSIFRIEGKEVIAEARIYRTIEEVEKDVYCSDFARELEGSGPVNKYSHTENALTSAIGRALANLGYTGNAERPSRSEMIKVARMEREHDAMLEYLRTYGPKVTDEALKQHIRDSWNEIKERYPLAREAVERVEAASGVEFVVESA